MNKILNVFLSSKAWLLFLLVMVLPIINMFLSSGTLFLQVPSQAYYDSSFCKSYQSFSPYIDSFVGMVFYGWLWSVATQLQVKAPSELKLKSSFFMNIFPIMFLYYVGMDRVLLSLPFVESWTYPSAILIPFVFLHFYVVWFVAKTIKTLEFRRQVLARETIFDFIAILLFPIGIWFLQPRVNKYWDNA